MSNPFVSASDAGDSGQIASIQWDFNYNGSSFNADPSANGNLTPSHAYTTPGTLEALTK